MGDCCNEVTSAVPAGRSVEDECDRSMVVAAASRATAANPEIIYISMAGFGTAPGPYRAYRSWGPNLSALS